MSRVRKLDRAILDESGPIDSEDQDGLVHALSSENSAAFRRYARILLLSMVVELPAVLYLARFAHTPHAAVLLLMLMLLSLVCCIYDVLAVGRSVQYVGKVVNKTVVFAVNALVLVQLAVVVWRQHMGLYALFVVVPVANAVQVVVLHVLHDGIGNEVLGLRGLQYKYKAE